ncbi:MAG: hypothetical protein ABJN69_08050 [Hellea sp.]
MELISKHELVAALYEAAIPSLEAFFKAHENEFFYGFCVEILAEEGYFHVGASSVESFQPTIASYLKDGFSLEDIMGDGIRWNNQEWAYFDLNYDCGIWEKEWQSTLDRLNAHKTYMYNLRDPEAAVSCEAFASLFEAAGREAFQKIIASGILDTPKKTPDFRAFVFEHHDVF